MENYKWIGLVRKFYNCSFYNDSNAVQMFLHIFLNAQREDKPYFDQMIMRGQFRTSIQNIMQFLKISRKSARRSLDKLIEAGIIHVASHRRNGVLITVREFSKFLALENMKGGWVKLYYDLDYQDFFEDAYALHLYLHILLHTYPTNPTYDSYDDPLWFDFKKISDSTGISIKDIKKSLQTLRKEGILNLGYNGQKKLSSVELIEFSDYVRNTLPVTPSISSIDYSLPKEGVSDAEIICPDEGSVFYSDRDKKEEQKESKEGPKDFQKNSSRNAYENSHRIFVNSYNSDNYNSMGKKEGQKREQKGLKVEEQKSLPSGYEEGYAREHIIKENRDKRIENGYYNNYSAVRKFSSIEELILDEEWVCSMQELYGFTGKETLHTALTLFLANLKCRKEEVPENLKVFLDYFCNWYKRNEKKLRPKLKAQITPNGYGRNLWHKCMSAFSRIVNDQVFASVFKPIAFDSFENSTKELTLRLPSKQLYDTLEGDYIETLKVVLRKFFGTGIILKYRLAGAK